MIKKKLFVALLMAFALIFTTLAGCDMTGGGTTSDDSIESVEIVESLDSEESESLEDSESLEESESEESEESEEESQSEEESESAKPLTVPTFELVSVGSTARSISFEVAENDPDEVGEITAIVLTKGNDKIVVEDMSTRTIDGLLSQAQYKLTVTYTYNVGEGDVSNDYSKNKYTAALRAPTVEIEYESNSQDSISFELKIKDPSEILNITSIYLIPEDGGDLIVLEDLSLTEFTGIANGFYEMVVEYEYDLNKGDGVTQDEVRLGVATKINPLSIVDFVVEVEEGRNPVILQITDTQIIDSSQRREGDNGISISYYAPENFGVRLENYLRETVEAVNPDLIIMTGDNVYGRFDDNGTSLLKLISVMESFQIPWAPVFGNHDNESKKGVKWQCDQFEAAEYCLFKRNNLEGNGNYTVGIAQGGELTRVFFMMDSNGCASPSAQSTRDGQILTMVGFGEKQIAWFEGVGAMLKTHTPNTKVSFAFHIQIHAFSTAYKKYGYSNTNYHINIDKHEKLEEGDMGYIGGLITGTWDNKDEVFAKMVSIGCDSIYIGHEHNMSASVVYEGVRFQFGQKIGTYDHVNWLMADGSIEFKFSPSETGDPIMGGSVNVLDETGAIADTYIYFCGGISHNGKQN